MVVKIVVPVLGNLLCINGFNICLLLLMVKPEKFLFKKPALKNPLFFVKADCICTIW